MAPGIKQFARGSRGINLPVGSWRKNGSKPEVILVKPRPLMFNEFLVYLGGQSNDYLKICWQIDWSHMVLESVQ